MKLSYTLPQLPKGLQPAVAVAAISSTCKKLLEKGVTFTPTAKAIIGVEGKATHVITFKFKKRLAENVSVENIEAREPKRGEPLGENLDKCRAVFIYTPAAPKAPAKKKTAAKKPAANKKASTKKAPAKKTAPSAAKPATNEDSTGASK